MPKLSRAEKIKRFAPPQPVRGKAKEPTYGTGKLSQITAVSAAYVSSPIKKPNASRLNFKRNPVSKVIPNKYARQKPKELQYTSRGRLILKSRGYVLNKGRKVPGAPHLTLLVPPGRMYSAKPKVVGKVANAHRVGPVWKGTAKERKMIAKLMNE